MKNIFPLIVVALSCLVLSPSCSKKSGSPAQTCRIITITDQNGASTTTYNITYNNAGQISTEQYSISGTAYNRVFTYIGNIEMVATSDGTTTITDSVTLNSDGLIASDYNTNQTNITVSTYTYSGTEVQKAVTVVNGGAPATTIYTFANGDLTSSSGSPNITYTYNTKASEIGDYWQVIQLINYGASFVRTAHQLAGYQYTGTVENINYTYDNTGKITVVTGTTGANVETITYQYSCN
jgi:hypothetical protein